MACLPLVLDLPIGDGHMANLLSRFFYVQVTDLSLTRPADMFLHTRTPSAPPYPTAHRRSHQSLAQMLRFPVYLGTTFPATAPHW